MPRRWTEVQKLERAEQVRKYWQEHGHPSLGKKHSPDTVEKMKKRKNRNPIASHCSLCGRALYNKESAKRGLGPTCAGLH